MPPKRSALSKTEWLIMKICWNLGQCTARAVFEETLKQKKRGYQTVKTMLDRLVVKGYLNREKLGPIYLYKATVPRNKVTARAIDAFVNTVLDSTFAPLLAHFTKKEKMTSDEREALKALIDSKGKRLRK